MRDTTDNQLIYLDCHNNARHMLEYDTVSGAHTLLKRDKSCPYGAFSRGSYILENVDFIALVPTASGPLLLINDNSYPLLQSQIRIELGDAPEGELNTFKVFSAEEEIFAIKYERPYSDLNYMIDNADADFFYWLLEGYNDPKAIEWHTLKPNQTCDPKEKEAEMPKMPPAESADLKGWEPAPLTYTWPETLNIYFDIASSPSMWGETLIILLLWCLETPFRAILFIAILSFLTFQLWLWGAA